MLDKALYGDKKILDLGNIFAHTNRYRFNCLYYPAKKKV